MVATKGGGIVPCPNGPAQTPDGEAGIRALSLHDVWERVVTPFATLNPYDPALVLGSVLKIEDVNYYNGAWQQLYALAISAKRYVLFNLDRHGQPVLRKPSEHGLGHLIDPSRGPGEPEYEQGLTKKERWPRWIGDVWRWLIAQARGKPIPDPAWFAQPAVSRITVTTPRLLESFAQYNAGRSYAESVKPMGFGLTVHLDRIRLELGYDKSRFQLIGPYETDANKRLAMPWIEKHTGREYRITTDPDGPPGAIVVRTIGQEIARYRVHPEAKSADTAGEPCSERTVGLLQRRPVYADRIVYIGKESHKLDDDELRAVAEVAEIRSFYRDPRETAWIRFAVPLLQLIPVATIAKAAQRSARMATHYRQGTKDPGDTARRRLVVLLLSEARRLFRRKATPPDARRVAERFLASGLANVAAKSRGRPSSPGDG